MVQETTSNPVKNVKIVNIKIVGNNVGNTILNNTLAELLPYFLRLQSYDSRSPAFMEHHMVGCTSKVIMNNTAPKPVNQLLSKLGKEI